jgi:hypothetical protein
MHVSACETQKDMLKSFLVWFIIHCPFFVFFSAILSYKKNLQKMEAEKWTLAHCLGAIIGRLEVYFFLLFDIFFKRVLH